MDEKNLNQDNIDTPVIPDDVILDDVIKDEEPTPPVEEKNVKLIPPYIFAIIVGVLSIIIAISVLVIQYKQNPRCVDHLDGNGDRLCDFCNLVIDNVNVPPHTHYYVEGVCQCGFVDVNYVAPPKTDYTSDVNNAAELFNDIFYGSYTKLDNNATLINLDISGSLASVLFAEGTPDTILLDTNKIFMNINKLGVRTQKYLWITDEGQYTTIFTNNEITATWQPKSLGVSQTINTVFVTGDDITYNIETGYFEVSREYLNQLQGNVMSPAFYILNQVPGLEDMDYGELEYLVKFKINEVNELTDFEIKGLADTKDVVSVVYSRQESRYQFSMVVRHGVLFQFNIVYSPQGANDNFLFNIVIEPAVDMYINAMDLSMRSHLTLGNAEVDFDDVTLKAMEEARKTYENAGKPHEHYYITNRDEPTCTSSGYITHACECGDLYVETLPVLGHDYVNGVCSRCNHAQNKVETTGFATFNSIVAENCMCSVLHSCLISIAPVTLTWDELMLHENGQKYGYDAGKITYETISKTAFEACGTLSSIQIPDTVTKIEDAAFYRCNNLSLVVLPKDLTEIGQYAFGVCTNLESIKIPDTVVSIGNAAFVTCEKLSNIQIGNNVTSIGSDAFEKTAYYKDNNNWQDGMLYLGNYLLCFNHLKNHNTNNTEITVRDGTTLLADNAFEANNTIQQIHLPESLTHIGSYVFNKCTTLEQITIGANVVYIGEGAFTKSGITHINVSAANEFYQFTDGILYDRNMTRLLWCTQDITTKNLVIPNTIQTIDAGAFANCDKLEGIAIPASVQYIGDDAFEDADNINTLYIEDLFAWCNINFGTLFSNPAPFSGNIYLANQLISETLVIPDGITEIKAYTFHQFPVKSVIIPNGITSIGKSAFSFCRNLTDISIPGSVQVVEDAFYSSNNIRFNEYNNCKYLGNTENPYLVLVTAAIKDESTYTIHAKTKIIAGGAFESCRAITSIVIPNSIVSIGEWAFYSLTYSDFEIYYNGTQREWNNINIGDNNSALKDAQIHYQK